MQHDNTGLCKNKPGQHRFTARHTVVVSARDGDKASSPSMFTAVGDKIFHFVDAQFLPVALLSALTVGYFQPAAAVAAKEAGIGKAATLVIFILSGTCTTPNHLRHAVCSELNEFPCRECCRSSAELSRHIRSVHSASYGSSLFGVGSAAMFAVRPEQQAPHSKAQTR